MIESENDGSLSLYTALHYPLRQLLAVIEEPHSLLRRFVRACAEALNWKYGNMLDYNL